MKCRLLLFATRLTVRLTKKMDGNDAIITWMHELTCNMPFITWKRRSYAIEMANSFFPTGLDTMAFQTRLLQNAIASLLLHFGSSWCSLLQCRSRYRWVDTDKKMKSQRSWIIWQRTNFSATAHFIMVARMIFFQSRSVHISQLNRLSWGLFYLCFIKDKVLACLWMSKKVVKLLLRA